MKYFLAFLAGAVVVFVVLKYVVKKKPTEESKTMENLLTLAKTEQAKELLKSEEFSELVKTDEFKKFATDFGTEALVNFILV